MRKILATFALVLVAIGSMAQIQLKQLDRDPEVRYGVLPNGLTYYVRHNAEPKGQAEFFIAQQVGSIQEEDNQRGLAHFLEHMCFNGTKNFPGKDLINYLESIGVQFGRNLNAYTSIDETVYNISAVPVLREGIVDSCLLILHDWSCDLLLEDKEIDSERGVIHEEWRTSDARRRMMTNLLPQIYPNSRYGYRMPIGTMEIVDNFPYQALRDYYHTWYRPDLQAILVVGDIDADLVVKKIENMFSHIPAKQNAKPREWLPVDDNEQPIVAVVSDKEQTVNNIVVAWKQPQYPREMRNTEMYYAGSYIENAVISMIEHRISELQQKPNPPFLGAGVGISDFYVSKTKRCFMFAGNYADGAMQQCLEAGLKEVERARRYGFAASEYERFRTNFLRSLEQSYTEREKRSSGSYVREYVSNFIDGDAIPGFECEYELMNRIANNVTVDIINQTLQTIIPTGTQNMVVVMQLTENAKAPEASEVLQMIADARAVDVEPYEDQVITQPLIQSRPTGGVVVNEQQGVHGSRVLTLGNGVRVVLRATDFQKDEIVMNGYRPGGTSIFPDSDIESLNWVNAIHSIMGLGEFSQLELGKVLTGKHATASVSLNSHSEQASGQCSVRDLETMLQLLTLHFSPQRIDNDAFASFAQRQRKALENQEANPTKSFQDTIRTIMAQNPARTVIMHPELIDRINLQRIKQIYDSRLCHADGFTFTFVGNIDSDSIRSLIVDYLGSLPVNGSVNKPVNRDQGIRKGVYTCMFNREMEMDRSTVLLVRQANVQCTMRNTLLMEYLEQALQKSVLEKMREEAGATYSPGVNGSVNHDAFADEASIEIYFQTSPDMRDALIKIAKDELQRMTTENISAEQVEKTRQLLLKNYAEAQDKNGYVVSMLNEYYRYGIDMNTGYEETVNGITPDDVRQFAKELLNQNNEVIVAMSPKTKE